MHEEPDRRLTAVDTMTFTEAWSIRSTLIMWTVWAREACSQARRARDAEQTFRTTYGDPDGTLPSRALGEELQAAVVAICSAAFAVEVVARSLATSLPAPAGRESNAGRVDRVLTASIADPGTAAALVDRWRTIITLRNSTVHYDEEEQELDWHPSGLTRTDPEAGKYNAEQANAAAQALIDTLTAVRDNPTPASAGVLQSAAALVDELQAILDL